MAEKWEEEEEVFRRLSAADASRLWDNELSYLDFFRIDSLLIGLELDALELRFAQRHADQFRDRIHLHIDRDCGDLDQLREWQDAFLAHIPEPDRTWVQTCFYGDDI